MEGKAALFKRFAGIDAWPICLDTQDTDQIVATVAAIAPGFGGINLEDISAPRCFEVERRLRAMLDIPVFHDDQHGTAIVVLAALTNALRVVGKDLGSVRITMSGAGAAGHRGAQAALGGRCQERGRLRPGGGRLPRRPRHERQPDLDRRAHQPRWLRRRPRGCRGRCRRLHRRVRARTCSSGEDVKTMASDAIVFALANPDPEVDPEDAREHAAVVATGRSDYPNQINNVLAFPGVFRGLLDAQSKKIDDRMLAAAAWALADVVQPGELGPDYIIPSVFHPEVSSRVAAAIREITGQGEKGAPQDACAGGDAGT